MPIDLGHQPLEMLGGAVRIQSRPVGPLLHEHEVPGILLIDAQLIREAQRLRPGLLHQLPIQGHDLLEAIQPDKILRDDFQHKWPLVQPDDNPGGRL
ncbi:hypothetical protein D3C78_1542930 [compost metagenome]